MRRLLPLALVVLAGCGSDRLKPGTIVTLDSRTAAEKETGRDKPEMLITGEGPGFELTRETKLEVISDDGPVVGAKKNKVSRLVKLRVLDGEHAGKTGEWYFFWLKVQPTR